MTNLFDTLRRLSESFVASDIMVAKEHIVSAENQQDASQLLEQNPQYDLIPLRTADRLVAFLERGSARTKTIQIQHVVSAGTPILDLVRTFCDRRHLFVLGQCEIVGLIHYSDLNDPVVKLPYFLLLEGLERKIADSIRRLVNKDVLPVIIKDPQRLAKIEEKMSALQSNAADRDFLTLLYFREILEAACRLNKLQLRTSEIEDLSVLRNRVAHAATDELVESHEDVRRLSRVQRICMSLLFESKPS